jgi:acyl carrier protein
VNADDARALLDRLLHRIAPEVDLETIDPHAELQEDLDLDSMDFLNLVTALHDETGIDVPERDYPRISTVEGFVTYLVGAVGEAGAYAPPSGRGDDGPR